MNNRPSPASMLAEDQQFLQYKEMQNMVMATVKKCFNECVNDFSTGKMSENETKCLDQCVKRTMGVQTELDMLFPMIDQKFK